MKVMHLISGGDSGGAKTHLFELLDKLKNLCEVSVGCLMKGSFYNDIIKKDITVELFEQRNRLDLSVLKDIRAYISNNKIELLHVHGARANFIAMFLKRTLDVPIVTTMHSDYLLDFDVFYKKLIFTNLNRLSLRRLNYFIAVSDSFKDMLISRGFRPNAIHTVYNGMDFGKIPKNPTLREEYAKKHGLSLDDSLCYVGIAARFDSVKGVDVFIRGAAKAYEKNKKLRFLIAGSGMEEDRLKSLVSELGIGETVTFLGYENDMYGFLNFIDINTLTSKCESFPYSMLEGAGMKKPMVASRVGGIPALVIDGETGYTFSSENYVEMAEKLLLLASDKDKIIKMGEAIEKRATTYFSSDTFAKTHMEIYSRILEDYKSKYKYDFVLSGYFGFNNSGDDALLKALIDDICYLRPSCRIAVLSKRPKETRRLFRVDAVRRMSPFAVFSMFNKSKILLSGGGSLIQDETSSKSLWYYLALIVLAKKKGMKVMQIANGIGPVNRERNRSLAAKIINANVDSITLREASSAKVLEEMGVTIPYTVTCDPAVTLVGSSKLKVDSILKNYNIPDGGYICVSIREWKNFATGFKRILAEALDYICDNYKLNIVFLPMHYPKDLSISKSVASKMQNKSYIIETPLSIEETIGVIRESSLTLAMRLHSLVYAVANSTGVIALRYDPKIDGFMDYFRQEYIADVETVNLSEIKHIIDEYFKNNDSEKNKALCDEMKLKAAQNAQFAIELMEKIV